MVGLFETGFAYRDKYGILHIADKALAEKSKMKDSEVKEVNVLNYAGYPMINFDGGLRSIVDYGDGKVFIDGNEKEGWNIHDKEKVPASLAIRVRNLLDKIGL